MARADRSSWQGGLGYYRDKVAEHRSDPVEPRINAAFHRLDSAETIGNVWQAIEDCIVVCVIAFLPDGLRLVEISGAQRDPAQPKCFAFELTTSPRE